MTTNLSKFTKKLIWAWSFPIETLLRLKQHARKTSLKYSLLPAQIILRRLKAALKRSLKEASTGSRSWTSLCQLKPPICQNKLQRYSIRTVWRTIYILCNQRYLLSRIGCNSLKPHWVMSSSKSKVVKRKRTCILAMSPQFSVQTWQHRWTATNVHHATRSSKNSKRMVEAHLRPHITIPSKPSRSLKRWNWRLTSIIWRRKEARTTLETLRTDLASAKVELRRQEVLPRSQLPSNPSAVRSKTLFLGAPPTVRKNKEDQSLLSLVLAINLNEVRFNPRLLPASRFTNKPLRARLFKTSPSQNEAAAAAH